MQETDTVFDPGLGDSDRKFLLAEARASIGEAFGPASRDGTGRRGYPIPKSCEASFGAFVTLKKAGSLRGCIGSFHASGTLHATVCAMARAAAFDDPRFEPVEEAELAGLDIEITVLSPMRGTDSMDEIEVGRHGLYIVFGGRSGVLLPQVAVEYGWDRDEFLAHTCRKAGIPPGSWMRPECSVYLFEGLVFGES